jgi:hypothetical protein
MSDMLAIATLGPIGSDSHNAAKIIASEVNIIGSVLLFDSFATSIIYAEEHGTLALVPAAYQEKDAHGRTTAAWADTHFRTENGGRLRLLDARVLPLKDIVVARHHNISRPQSVALHAATQFYADTYLPNASCIYTPSKPNAVELCVTGKADACIGSLDVVSCHSSDLYIIHTVKARMCWTIYGSPNLKYLIPSRDKNTGFI